MNAHRIRIALAALLPLATVVLVGCHGSSPTETSSPSLAMSSSKTLVAADDHGGGSGGDDNGGGTEPGDDHGGHGDDDAVPTPTASPSPTPGTRPDDHGDDHGDDPAPTPTPSPAPTPGNQPDDHGQHQGQGDDRRRNTIEIQGRVTAVGPASLTIAGKVVHVDATTKFNRRGDLTSLARTSAALAAGKLVRAEARATRLADRSLLAQTIKIEVD